MDHTELNLVLYILAALCFGLFAFNVNIRHVHLLGLGVLFWSLVPLLETLDKLN